MTTIAEAFPLQWPIGRVRTPDMKRGRAKFKTSFGAARAALLYELQRLGARPGSVVLSTNVPIRMDGLPYANMRTVDGDPGVAVYFLDKNRKQTCIACDRWDSVHDNIQAIRLTIEALRGLDRWGTSQMVEAAFSGFQALPPVPGTMPGRPWWEVFGIPNHLETHAVEDRYLALARNSHPDRNGGDDTRFKEVNDAYQAFKRERGLS